MQYDIIGDIHGYASSLKALLSALGYEHRAGAWRCTDRQVIFVGDFIDRGPQQLETVEIVRRMVDAGAALAVMGNHEFNAIAWYLEDRNHPGEYLRPHNSAKYGNKNFVQHRVFLEALGQNKALHEELINWFFSLPVWLDLPDLRVVHACWHDRFIKYLIEEAGGAYLDRDLMVLATKKPDNEADIDNLTPSIYKAFDSLLKGLEVPLFGNLVYVDKDGMERRRVRVRWWDRSAETYRTGTSSPGGEIEDRMMPDTPLPLHVRLDGNDPRPVFFGHYWLTGTPRLLSGSAFCADYSVAKGGVLATYRWNGENELNAGHIMWVDSNGNLGRGKSGNNKDMEVTFETKVKV